MKTLKSKIQTPFILLSVIIPLATLISFNLSIKLYVENNVKNMLNASLAILENTKLPEYMVNIPLDNFDNLLKILVNINVIVYEEHSTPTLLNNSKDNFANEAIIQKVTQRLPSMQKSKIYTIRMDGKKYYIAAYPFDYELTTIVYIAQANTANKLIEVTNMFLLVIMLCGIVIALSTSHIISMSIVKKFNRLCAITQHIGKGNFISELKPDSDILELNMLYQSILQMSIQLDDYDKAQKTFLQNASHELRTPLMSIQGYAEGIENGIFKDTSKAAQIIHSESIRLNNLVNDLLTLSRIENNAYFKELTPINLNNTLKEYMQRLEGFAVKENIQPLLILPNNALFTLAEDELLSQAFLNIASNCIRYAKSTIQVSLFQQDKKVVIRIIDDGPGIAPEDLPHIFERFYKGKNGNFGLGLSIAQKAIECLGGKISVQSSTSGSIFEIQLNETNSVQSLEHKRSARSPYS